MSDATQIAGAQRCLFGTSADNHCGEPATVHILQVGEVPTMDCTRHVSWWETHAHLDSHPIGGACGLPGTTWMPNRDGEPGRCVVEGLGASVVDEAEAE